VSPSPPRIGAAGAVPRAESADAALEALLTRHARSVRRQIESHRLDRHGIDPDDVEQEVRIRLWRALERGPNTPLPASYIQRVVLSVLVDAVRRAQARPAEPLPEVENEEFEPLGAVSVRPDRCAVDAERMQQVAAAIAAIPVRRRRPLQLYLQGFTLPELAPMCDLTADAARKLVYRGLDELKQRLRETGLENFDD
jgi:RNA polymerase sigma factor (sigma-70 family)